MERTRVTIEDLVRRDGRHPGGRSPYVKWRGQPEGWINVMWSPAFGRWTAMGWKKKRFVMATSADGAKWHE